MVFSQSQGKMMNHLQQAKFLWKKILRPHDVVIDATIGNGKDTLFLAKLAGKVYGYDIQKDAIYQTKSYLEKHNISHVHIFHQSHEDFSFIQENIRLIVYNLGYLPGGDKNITTKVESTLRSVQQAFQIASFVSITCYPGHKEGKREEDAIDDFLQKIDPKTWNICKYTWPNRKLCPSLIFATRESNHRSLSSDRDL